MTKLPTTEYPALQNFVMKGVSNKDKSREAIEELRELIDALTTIADDMDDALSDWEEGDDRESRAEGKERLEQCVTDLDSPLSNAGFCAGQKPYEPED